MPLTGIHYCLMILNFRGDSGANAFMLIMSEAIPNSRIHTRSLRNLPWLKKPIIQSMRGDGINYLKGLESSVATRLLVTGHWLS